MSLPRKKVLAMAPAAEELLILLSFLCLEVFLQSDLTLKLQVQVERILLVLLNLLLSGLVLF